MPCAFFLSIPARYARLRLHARRCRVYGAAHSAIARQFVTGLHFCLGYTPRAHQDTVYSLSAGFSGLGLVAIVLR